MGGAGDEEKVWPSATKVAPLLSALAPAYWPIGPLRASFVSSSTN